MKLKLNEIGTLIKFLFRRNLYARIGLLVTISLMSELGAYIIPFDIPYDTIIAEHGLFVAIALALFIGKFFGVYWFVSILIKCFLIWLCMYFNYRLLKEGKDYVLIKNWNIGIGNKIKNITTIHKE